MDKGGGAYSRCDLTSEPYMDTKSSCLNFNSKDVIQLKIWTYASLLICSSAITGGLMCVFVISAFPQNSKTIDVLREYSAADHSSKFINLS